MNQQIHSLSRCGLFLLSACSLLSLVIMHFGNAQEAPVGADPEQDIVNRTVYDLGDHTVEFRQVTEETLPPLPRKAEPSVPSEPSPELLAQRHAWLATQAKVRFISLGGTVHLSDRQPAWTELHSFAGSGGAPVLIHSSIDWNLLRRGRFILPDGTSLCLMLLITTTDEDRMTAAFAARGKTYLPPARPDFPPGKACWTVVSGIPTAELTMQLDALHAIHDLTYDQLVEALRVAEQAATDRQREEVLRAAQPLPDVIIRYRVLTAEELKNR